MGYRQLDTHGNLLLMLRRKNMSRYWAYEQLIQGLTKIIHIRIEPTKTKQKKVQQRTEASYERIK